MRRRLLIQGQPSSSAPICVHPQLQSGQRILPFETREACEISVGRTKYEAVLDCDRGQMRRSLVHRRYRLGCQSNIDLSWCDACEIVDEGDPG
jgi:hypothetical protein